MGPKMVKNRRFSTFFDASRLAKMAPSPAPFRGEEPCSRAGAGQCSKMVKSAPKVVKNGPKSTILTSWGRFLAKIIDFGPILADFRHFGPILAPFWQPPLILEARSPASGPICSFLSKNGQK